MAPQFNLGERIKQVRAVEAKIKAMEDELDAKLKPYEDFTEAARAEILQFLNQTNQKSANTEYGTAYWKPKITYRVADKDEFKRHVIGMEQWELLTWATALTAAEAFTNEHGEPPPGTVPQQRQPAVHHRPSQAAHQGGEGQHQRQRRGANAGRGERTLARCR